MLKREFKYIAWQLGYNCSYSGKNKTFYLIPSIEYYSVPGDMEYQNELYAQLDISGFNFKVISF